MTTTDRRRIPRRAVAAACVLLGRAPIHASPADVSPPRVIARVDVGLLGSPNVGAGGGGGISIPTGSTGAGLDSAGGIEIGAEVRLGPWIAADASVGQYRPDLEVDRDRSPDAMLDSRSAPVDLRTLKFGLLVTPPTWRADRGRVAIGVVLSRADVSNVPPGLGIVCESDSGVGIDLRADLLLSKDRRWGAGAALSFEDLDPQFVDLETGAVDSLQVSGMFLRLGVRGAW